MGCIRGTKGVPFYPKRKRTPTQTLGTELQPEKGIRTVYRDYIVVKGI